MSIDVQQARGSDPVHRQFVGTQIEALVALPEDGALAGGFIDEDVGQLARAVGHLDQPRLHSFARQFLALQSAGGIVANLSHVAAAQSPAVAGNCGRGGLPSGQARRRR